MVAALAPLSSSRSRVAARPFLTAVALPFSVTPVTQALLGALLGLALCLPAPGARAQAGPAATETLLSFDVPASTLDQALSRLGRQAGAQIAVDAEITAGLTSPGVSGRYTVADALQRLLAGTGLEAVRDTSGEYTLRQAAPPRGKAGAAGASGRPTLPTVRVTGSTINDAPLGYLATHSETGALGDRSVLDTPFSVSLVNSDAIVERGARSLSQVFANDISVSGGASPSLVTNWSGPSIRGLELMNFFVDGVPLSLDWGGEFPLEITESVTALKGLTGFMYGFGTPGGALSYQLKRPGDSDDVSVSLGWRNPSLVSLHVDASRKLADDLGIRANVATEHGTSYNGSKVERSVGSLAIDKHFRGAVNWSSTLVYESNHIKNEPLLFDIDGAYSDAALPRPSYRYDDIRVNDSYFNTRTMLASTGIQWKINDRWRLKYQLGASRRSQQYSKMFGALLNAAGDYDGYTYQYATRDNGLFAQTVLQGEVFTGSVRNEIVAGLGARRVRSRGSNDFYWSKDFEGNLYQAQPFESSRAPDFSLAAPSVTTQKYVFLSDAVHFNERWQLIVGLRYNHYQSRDEGDTDSPGYKTNKLSPTLAVIYKPDAATRLYGSYVENLEPGLRVGPPNANAGEVLDATVSKQYEIGLKRDADPLSYTAALFRIERANVVSSVIGESRYLSQDGLNIHHGAELSAAYKVSPTLKLGVSAVYLNGTIDKVSADNPDLQGKTPIGMPKWQTALFGQYRLAGLERLKLHGNVQYVGSAWATEQNNVEAGSTTLFNAGFSYDFSLGEHDLTLIGNVYNLFDRKYWRLIPNIARTYMGEGRNVSLSIVGRF